MQQWLAQAPANIALIKYMGKDNPETNLPANPSLSFTLDRLKSNVSLEACAGTADFWEPLEIPGIDHFELSHAAQQRFLNHLAFLKQTFNYNGGFIVRSNNTFPLGTGLASSASSFAALTKCALLALSELTQQTAPNDEQAAILSRHGSGSSCRSFFAPWALWEGEQVVAVDLPYPDLLHEVILVSHDAKAVSSSKAHELITTSPHYASRPERAKQNLDDLLVALRAKNWSNAYDICWHEFQDMHQLFTTCAQPFTYMTEETLSLLDTIKDMWQRDNDGPIVTMDAGPNIHLLYRPDQVELARVFKQDVLIGNFDVL
ncbi:MAG: diphosphomevalonate decarboxylase [Gammaproteobacteria bacterium]|nr:diphosphomevalonate decarboxylase [Gammaproteobacteria bacterium]